MVKNNNKMCKTSNNKHKNYYEKINKERDRPCSQIGKLVLPVIKTYKVSMNNSVELVQAQTHRPTGQSRESRNRLTYTRTLDLCLKKSSQAIGKGVFLPIN